MTLSDMISASPELRTAVEGWFAEIRGHVVSQLCVAEDWEGHLKARGALTQVDTMWESLKSMERESRELEEYLRKQGR